MHPFEHRDLFLQILVHEQLIDCFAAVSEYFGNNQNVFNCLHFRWDQLFLDLLIGVDYREDDAHLEVILLGKVFS